MLMIHLRKSGVLFGYFASIAELLIPVHQFFPGPSSIVQYRNWESKNKESCHSMLSGKIGFENNEVRFDGAK